MAVTLTTPVTIAGVPLLGILKQAASRPYHIQRYRIIPLPPLHPPGADLHAAFPAALAALLAFEYTLAGLQHTTWHKRQCTRTATATAATTTTVVIAAV